MRRRLWLMFGSLFLFVVLGFCIVAVNYFMPKLTSVDPKNVQVAQYALDHSPMDHVTRVYWFTGGPLEPTVVGTDAFHKTLYVFVNGQSTVVVYQNQVITPTKASTIAQHHEGKSQVVSVVPGYVNPNTTTTFGALTSDNAVYEVTLLLPNGRYAYVYEDMYTGAVLWSFRTTLHISL